MIFTNVKKNMKQIIINAGQKFYLSKRGLIETVIDQLKNICQIEHSRHRNPENAVVNLISGLIAHGFKLKKPSIKINKLPQDILALASN
jgi:hypothetical protein